jgi:hypothetical protein
MTTVTVEEFLRCLRLVPKAPDAAKAGVAIYRFGKYGVIRIPKRESA